MLQQRTPTEVFEDHLRLRVAGDLETDLRRNYSQNVTLLTANSNAQGHDAMRMSARRLAEQLPGARFEFLSKQVNGPYALLIWRGWSDHFDAMTGADSFVIDNGKIQMQTIHFQLIDDRARLRNMTKEEWYAHGESNPGLRRERAPS